MRSLADIFGIVVAGFGLIIAIASCAVMSTAPAASFTFWLGVAMILGGWLIGHSASTKTCPQCTERVKYQAQKCKQLRIWASPRYPVRKAAHSKQAQIESGCLN